MKRLPAIAASLLLLLGIWEAIVLLGFVPEEYFPGPIATAKALSTGLLNGELSRALVQTFLRALVGTIGASLFGVGLALLTARYRTLQLAIDPIAELIRPLPPAALVPISIFFLGLGWALHAFILLFACLWPVYLGASAALKTVPIVQLRTAATFGYSDWTRVLHVQLPAALPEIFIGVRIASSIALIATVVTEMLAGRDGLGFVVNDAATTLRIPEVFAALLLTMVSGLILNAIVLAVRRRMVGWHIELTAGNRR